jgi:dTDP-4-dehydrorhamnose reductase
MFLLVGGDSEIGAATNAFLTEQGHPVAATTRQANRASPDRPLLDLAAPLEAWEPPAGTRSACIFAAMARLAACAADPAGTARINVTQTLALLERLLARGIHVLFLSTNQVFDGSIPHTPANAPASPISEYGRQKARVEAALHEHIQLGAPAAILRLSKVVSRGMPLIGDWMMALCTGREIRAFHDMTLAPVPTEMVSSAVGVLMQDRASGVYQLTGPRDISYADVGRFLAGHLDADPSLVAEISALEAGLPEGATPRHTTLDSSLLRDRYGLQVPDVWQVIEEAMTATKEGVQAQDDRRGKNFATKND